jgi:hypothetical protein
VNLLFANENREQRERLTKLANAMTDEQLLLPLYEEGWTIATALGHLAFWDERRRVQLINWAKSGVKSSPIDGDTINDAMIPLLNLIPAREAANLGVSTASAIDNELMDISPETVDRINASGDIHALDRSVHRKMHLDEIEALLARSK